MSTPSATLSAVSGGGTTSSTCQHHQKVSVVNYIVVKNKFEVLANTLKHVYLITTADVD
jgi:hypothetical protein